MCIGITESIHCTIRSLLQTPRPAQINDAQATLDRLGNPLARKLVGRRQEHDIDSSIFHALPRKRFERESAVARQLRIRFAQIGIACILSVALDEQRLLDGGVTRKQTHELQPAVTGRSKHSGLYSGIHVVRQTFKGYGFTGCCKLDLRSVSKGRTFRYAIRLFIFVVPRGFSPEESAFTSFQRTALATEPLLPLRKIIPNTSGQFLRDPGVMRDDQDGVVSPDGAHHFLPLLGVDGC